MLRLLTVLFLSMFCKLVFCKLKNMKWPGDATSYLTEVFAQNG